MISVHSILRIWDCKFMGMLSSTDALMESGNANRGTPALISLALSLYLTPHETPHLISMILIVNIYSNARIMLRRGHGSALICLAPRRFHGDGPPTSQKQALVLAEATIPCKVRICNEAPLTQMCRLIPWDMQKSNPPGTPH